MILSSVGDIWLFCMLLGLLGDIHLCRRSVTFTRKEVIILKMIDLKIKAMKYHLIVRMAIIKKSINKKCQQGCGEKGILLHCGRECKLV